MEIISQDNSINSSKLENLNNSNSNSAPPLIDSHPLESKPKQSKDKTFNNLRELQLLLKKESALRELCKKKIFKFYNKYFSLY